MTFEELKAKKLANPRQYPAVHGTRSKYKSGCRCDLCKISHNSYARDYYRKHHRHYQALKKRSDPQPTIITPTPTIASCQHHWKIDSPDGPESRGVCVKCFEIRMFRNSGNDVKSERTGGWF